MTALGTLMHETKSGNLVLRGNEAISRETPPMYSYAGTKTARIGKIHDIIGPRTSPYVIIKPEKRLSRKNLSSLIGEIFYESSRRNYSGKKRSSGRKKGRLH